MNTNSKIISLFKKCVETKKINQKKYNKLSELAFKSGYIIEPKCNLKYVEEFLKEESFNPNSTFYKTWQDITSKSRFELFIDQIIHYSTTYGTDFSMKNGFVPNNEPVKIDYSSFKVIKSATKKEIFDDCKKMLESGIALNSKTINILLDFIIENNFSENVELDKIQNKEAQAIFSIKLNRLPNDEFGMLRALVYFFTNSALLIKSKECIRNIKFNSKTKDLTIIKNLSESQMEKLSRIFYRYKPLFLAMKNKETAKVINRIRKLAKKNHTPLEIGFWENVLSVKNDVSEIEIKEKLSKVNEEIDNINNFKKLSLMQTISERLLDASNRIGGKMFVIRNGKMFVRENYKTPCNVKYLFELYKILENSVVESLKKKSCKIKLPNSVNLTVPTSEKNFVGNYPFGTSVEMGDSHNVIGIYWRNEWGTNDFDLHYTDLNGRQFGWCYDYKDEESDIIFSGDMTNAEPEATELFYIKNNAPDGIVKVSKYWGEKNSHFKLFVAKEDLSSMKVQSGRRENEPIMCDPNNIKFEAMIDHDDNFEKTVAYVHDNKIYLMSLDSGNQRVPSNKANDIIQKQMSLKFDSFIQLKPLLEKAGFEFVENDLEKDETCDLDLSDIKKDDLIKLFL